MMISLCQLYSFLKKNWKLIFIVDKFYRHIFFFFSLASKSSNIIRILFPFPSPLPPQKNNNLKRHQIKLTRYRLEFWKIGGLGYFYFPNRCWSITLKDHFQFEWNENLPLYFSRYESNRFFSRREWINDKLKNS